MRAFVIASLIMITAQPAVAAPLKFAEAHCIITGATGSGSSKRSVGEAMEKAIASCIGRGGVPACCRKGAHPVSGAE